MDNWHPGSLMHRKQTIFEYGLFCFVTTLCAVDHMNHANAIEPNDEERRIPTSFELMNLKNGDSISDTTYL